MCYYLSMEHKVSAGLLMYRQIGGRLEVFLTHPGGPFFKNRDNGFWGIPKGLVDTAEDLLETAKREFEEETGIKPTEPFTGLSNIEQRNNKTVFAWAFSHQENVDKIKSNTFTLEWPPKSGNIQEFPEIDKGEFYNMENAKQKMRLEQQPFLDRLRHILFFKGL